MRLRVTPTIRLPSTAARPRYSHHTDPSTATHTPVTPVHRHLQLRVPLMTAPPRPPRHPTYDQHTVHLTITPSQSSMHTSPLLGSAGCSRNSVQRAQGAAQRMHRSAGSVVARPHTNL